MERLTAREESGNAYYPHCFKEDICGGMGCGEKDGICEFSEKVCERLAAYEDTNLTPEQIVELKETSLDPIEMCKVSIALDKLKKYQELEEDGLLLRLPCKDVFESSGDIVYYIFDYEIVECINCGISIDCDGKTWIALACDEHIFPYREPIAEIDTDPTDWCMNTTVVSVDEWGKTVFLAQEEAEQALKRLESEQK